MRTIDVRKGREAPQQIPIDFGDPDLDRLTETYERVQDEERQAGDRVKALESELDQARAADRDTLAEALIEGGSRPKESAGVSAVEKRLAAARRELEGAEQARRKIASQVAALVIENASTWAEHVEQEFESLREEWQKALDVLEATAQRLADLSARRTWALSAASGSARLKVGGANLPVHELSRRDGTPYGVTEAITALRSVGQPLERPKRKTMDELETERRERVRRANEREAAFEERAREVSETMPRPAA